MSETTTATVTPDASLADILAGHNWPILAGVAARVTAELDNLAPSVNVSAEDVLSDLARHDKNVAAIAAYRKAVATLDKARATLETVAETTLDNKAREISDARKANRAKAIERLTTVAFELLTVTKIATFGDETEKVQATLLHAKLTDILGKAKGTIRAGKVSGVAEIRQALRDNGYEVGERGQITPELMETGRALLGK